MSKNSSKVIFANPMVRLMSVALDFDSPLSARERASAIQAMMKAELSVQLPDDDDESNPIFETVDGPDLTAVWADSFMLMTARYERWQRVRDCVALVHEAVGVSRNVAGLSMWYLNEIRPPEGGQIDAWSEYTRLPVGASGLDVGPIAGAAGSLLLCPGEARHISIEWTHTSSPAIDEESQLADYYEQPATALLAIELNATANPVDVLTSTDMILAELDILNGLVKKTFMSLLTPKAVAIMEGDG